MLYSVAGVSYGIFIVNHWSLDVMVWMNMCGAHVPLEKIPNPNIKSRKDRKPIDTAWVVGIETKEQETQAENEGYVWGKDLDAWLTSKLQPKIESTLACENASLRVKVVELRREIDALVNLNDNMRHENTKLRSHNDELRRDNLSLQM